MSQELDDVANEETGEDSHNHTLIPVFRTAWQQPLVMTELDGEESRRLWNHTTPPPNSSPTADTAWDNANPGNPEPTTDAHGQRDDWDVNEWAAREDDGGDAGWGNAAADDIDGCPGCGDEVTDPDAIYIGCGHAWHRECLNDNFRNALTSRINWPAKCCDRIEHAAVQEYLDEDVLMVLFDRVEEFDSVNPVFCSNFDCSTFISDALVAAAETYFVTCPMCDCNTCKKCKAGARQHPMPGLCPMYLSHENEELAKKEGWKQCPHPGCRTWIERTEGCDTMECAACKTEFCFRCGAKIQGIPCNCAGQNAWVEDLEEWRRNDNGEGEEGEDDGEGDSEDEQQQNDDESQREVNLAAADWGAAPDPPDGGW
jgi:hypothetical protein